MRSASLRTSSSLVVRELELVLTEIAARCAIAIHAGTDGTRPGLQQASPHRRADEVIFLPDFAFDLVHVNLAAPPVLRVRVDPEKIVRLTERYVVPLSLRNSITELRV
jgi:hypothetical protein